MGAPYLYDSKKKINSLLFFLFPSIIRVYIVYSSSKRKRSTLMVNPKETDEKKYLDELQEKLEIALNKIIHTRGCRFGKNLYCFAPGRIFTVSL